MKNLESTYTEQELVQALNFIQGRIEERDDLFDLFIMGRYYTTCRKEFLIDFINEKISEKNTYIDIEKQNIDALSLATSGATHAVLLDEAGSALYRLRTNKPSGEYEAVARAVSADGTPVNISQYKVSRNKKHLKKHVIDVYPALDKFGDVYFKA